MPVYSVTIRNRAVAALVGLLVLGAGAALLVLGIALLAGLAVAGGLLGTGILVYRKLRGHSPLPVARERVGTLDPSLEVFPETPHLETPHLARPADVTAPTDNRTHLPPA